MKYGCDFTLSNRAQAVLNPTDYRCSIMTVEIVNTVQREARCLRVWVVYDRHVKRVPAGKLPAVVIRRRTA